MSLTVFFIVLFAAALHAIWNAVVKGGSDTLLATILVAATAGLIGLCALPFLPPMAAVAWWYLAASAVLEITYYTLIAAAYRNSDMSRTYPLMRGMPPLLVALVSALVFGVDLSLAAWLGIALISVGVISLIFASHGTADPRGVRFALMNAGIIASYTLVDGFGVRASGSPATYVMWVFVLTGLPLGLWALLRRPTIVAYARRNWSYVLIGGIGTLVSYGLALWAMTQAPIPLVAALRETSILFGAVIAVLVLKEKVTAARIIAILMVALGAVALRLA